ncbi:MAG: isoprenyl transferase [Gammaproteobacteria bacterium]|nr:isoprenyl transferase [Gammaproteobacteria bacterium]
MNKLPKHVAIVMDGNGRWAQKKCLPRVAGHEAGAESVKQIVKTCSEKEIGILTLFAFSSENWRRPPEEVEHLMNLFLQTLRQETENLHKNNIRLRVIGDCKRFNDELREQIHISQTMTEQNTGLTLVIAANYSGRWDIVNATHSIAKEVVEGKIQLQDITPELFQNYVCLNNLPEPDLFIRTSGEQRISNFMLWQFAYTELYFSDVLWPDFKEKEFQDALNFYASRERRFGLISEQLSKELLDA